MWDRFSELLLLFFAKRVNNIQDAEDLRQEVLLLAYSKFDQLENPKRFNGWIWQIAKNVLAEHYRKMQKSLEPEIAVDDEQEELLKIAEGCLNQNLESLPIEYLEPLKLAYFDGLNQQQVADKLGLTLSATKSRIQRGRALLKQSFYDCCEFDLNANRQWANDKWEDCVRC